MKKLAADRTWEMVHAARQALLADLADLPTAAYETPSLCAGWSVHDVLAHLTESTLTTRWGFLRQMVRARGDFDRANTLGIEREKRSDPRETLAAFRAAAPLTRTPPAALGSRLEEVYVHGEDIRRPLGIPSSPDPVGVLAAIRYRAATSTSMGGAKELLRSVRLVPDDLPADSAVGSGPEAYGRAIDLLLATSGRKVADGAVSGPGLEVLSAQR